jgi:hypothetical protein
VEQESQFAQVLHQLHNVPQDIHQLLQVLLPLACNVHLMLLNAQVLLLLQNVIVDIQLVLEVVFLVYQGQKLVTLHNLQHVNLVGLLMPMEHVQLALVLLQLVFQVVLLHLQ